MSWTSAASQATCDALRRFSKFGWLLFPKDHPEMPKVWGGVPPKQQQQLSQQQPGKPAEASDAAGVPDQQTQTAAQATDLQQQQQQQQKQSQAHGPQLPRKRQKLDQPSVQQHPTPPQPPQHQKVAELLDEIHKQAATAVQLAAAAHDLGDPFDFEPASELHHQQSGGARAQESETVEPQAHPAREAAMKPPAPVQQPPVAQQPPATLQNPKPAAKKPAAAARKPPKPPAQTKRKVKQTQAQLRPAPNAIVQPQRAAEQPQAASQLQPHAASTQLPEAEDLDAPTPARRAPAKSRTTDQQEAEEQLLQELDEQLAGNSLNALQHEARVSKAGKEPARKARGLPQKWSTVNLANHMFYLTHAGREAQLPPDEQQKLQEIAVKIRAEQEKFRAVRQAEGLQEAADSRRFDYVDPRASAQIESRLEAKREAVKAHARNWQYDRSIKLDAAALTVQTATSDLKHLHIVQPAADSAAASSAEEATAKFRMPEEGTRISLDQPWLSDDSSQAASSAPDAAAAAISAVEGAHAFLAASALSALVKLLGDAYDTGFELPVQVVAASRAGTGSVVIMQKPLLQRSLTLRQKHELLYKRALMHISQGKSAEGEPQEADAFEEDLDAQLFGSDEKPDKAAGRSCAETAPTFAPIQRIARHDVWQLGGLKLVTCAHTLPSPSEDANEASADVEKTAMPDKSGVSRGLVMRAKMEYQGAEAKDAEEVTREEQAAWWLALKLRPGCCLTVGHVAVKESRLVRTRSYAEGDIHAAAQASFFGNLLAKLLGVLRNQPHGQYLLTHLPGADVIDCLKALPGNDRKVGAVPLPTGRLLAGQTYDLWAAHAASGATDTSKVPFVPRLWKPADASLRQVPDTFPVKSSKSKRALEGEATDEAAVKRKRKRRLGPSAWVQDKDDWDSAPEPATAAAMQAYQAQLDL